MATYKGIQGFTIQNLSADPSNPIEGQVWYNSTSNVWKVEEFSSLGSWATGGALPVGKSYLAGCGTQTAALGFGGYTYPPPVTSATSEEYDGSAWTAGGTMGTARKRLAGAGTQTAGLAFGGTDTTYSALTEEYDGSAWTTGGVLGNARNDLGGAGTQTAGLAFGGFNLAFGPTPATRRTTLTEEYDGSAWTAGGALPTATSSMAGAGTQTVGLGFAGYNTTYAVQTYEYDGSSWTAGGNLTTGRSKPGGTGTQTSALAFGGTVSGGGRTAATEQYDGTSWGAASSMSISRNNYPGAAGDTSAGLAWGGRTDAADTTTATEEYTAGLGTQTITVS